MGMVAAVGAAAVAGIAGSVLSSNAASSAASTQAGAADRATAASQQEAAQTRADLAPYNQAGQAGTNALMASLGLGGSGPNLLAANGINGLTFQPTQAQLASTPGYQFDLAQGQQGVANSNAAAGRGISGAALKGAANFATGLANNTLTTQQGIFQQNLGNVLNPLQNVANLGENAAAQTGQLGTSNTNAANASAIGGANASAAGQVGSANAISGGLSSLGGAPLNYALYNQLLGGGGSNGFSSTSNNFMSQSIDPTQ
jgi:hypothetical protein